MKSKIIVGAISLLLILPMSGQAFSIDSALMGYINYLKGRIATLEAENAQLRASSTPNLGVMTITKKTKAVETKRELGTVTIVPTGEEKDGKNVDVVVEGVFDTAYLLVKNPDSYDIATVHLTKADKVNLNALKEGKYTYILRSKQGDDTVVIDGAFVIE